MQASEAGIHRLSIPTPFAVGRVNCYLLEDEPLTLVDTGPNSGKSLDELEQALARHGRTIEDLQLVVITHQHMDHLGLLEIIARRSGAQVAALHTLRPYLADFSASAEADDAFAQEVMRRHGVPQDLSAVLRSVGAAFRAFGCSADVTRPLREGETIELRDRSLRVLHRPGHSPSDTVFWDEQRGILIGGDHLLAHISSNPLLSRPLEPTADSEPTGLGRSRALLDYIDSMRATRELPLRLVLPGHGEPIEDHVALIDERLRMHERRAGKVARMLDDGPLSAYEIALRMWGNIALTQAYLTISEVLGHIELLLASASVREEEKDGVVRFSAVSD